MMLRRELLLLVMLVLAIIPACARSATTGAVDAPPVEGGTIEVAAAGDICERGALSSGCAATADLVVAQDPDVVLALGDQQYERGKLEEFERNYDPNWGRFLAKTLPTPGNHDKYGASGYDEYFDKPQHYVVDLGSWSVVSVDSNEAGSASDFVREQLPLDDHVIVMWHHARYSSGSDHGSDPEVDDLWEAARTGRACLVMYSHDHVYERGVSDGLPWFLVGTGGGEQHDDFIEADRVAGSEVAIAQKKGVLFLSLARDGGYRFRFDSTEGPVLDRGAASCES
jgi:hypothetical protein